jgi:hypothetical protein
MLSGPEYRIGRGLGVLIVARPSHGAAGATLRHRWRAAFADTMWSRFDRAFRAARRWCCSWGTTFYHRALVSHDDTRLTWRQ